jgi:hypothetical protein
LVDACEGGAFSSAGATGDGDLVDGMFCDVSDGVVFDVLLEVDLIECVFKVLDTDLLVLECGLEEGLEFVLLFALALEVIEGGSETAQ